MINAFHHMFIDPFPSLLWSRETDDIAVENCNFIIKITL